MYKLTLRCFSLKFVDYSGVGWWFCNEENLKLYLPFSISFDFDILFIIMLVYVVFLIRTGQLAHVVFFFRQVSS